MATPTPRYMEEHYAGCVQARISRACGTIVAVYRAAEAGLDVEGGPWATVCETHGAIANYETRKRAERFAPRPDNWCEVCAGQTDYEEEEIVEIVEKIEVIVEERVYEQARMDVHYARLNRDDARSMGRDTARHDEIFQAAVARLEELEANAK